jgi:hypothetical protein
VIDLNNLTPLQLQELEAALMEALSTTTPPPPPLEYRAYYGEDGKITTYTTEDLPGNYIVVTKEEYQQARHDAIVKSGVLVFTHIKNHVLKLVLDRNNTTEYRASKYIASVIIEDYDDIPSVYYSAQAYEIKR